MECSLRLGKVTPKISGYFPNDREIILIQPIQVSSQSSVNIKISKIYKSGRMAEMSKALVKEN